MFEKLNKDVIKVLKKNENLLETFSTETKLNILETAETGNTKALKQEIEYNNLCGDY